MAARLLGAAERGINFGISAPPAASALPALGVTSADLLAAVPAHGYDPAGLVVLRAVLAERHSAAGLPTTTDQITVTHGAQHAIDLALAILCEPGDAVAVEDPTYPGVLDVIAARRLRAIPLAGDARGPTAAVLESAARDHGARLAFLLPAVHNPTGRVLDPGRRQALARALDKLEMTVVEDNTLADLTYDDQPSTPRRTGSPSSRLGAESHSVAAGRAAHPGRNRPAGEVGTPTPSGTGSSSAPSGTGSSSAPGANERRATAPGQTVVADGRYGPRRSGPAERPASMAALCRRAVVVTVETTSKVAWGGLRIGWMRAPAGVIERSVQLRTSGDLGCSVPAQLLALQLLEHYDELIAARRAALRQSAARFAALLVDAIPGCSFDHPAGGLSVWVRLPDGADAAAFASRALRHGVSVAPGQFASPTGGHDHLRLCHDRPDEELVEGTARLAAAWSETTLPRILP
ncbi:MAG: PLP-dependent aminotransferase family protein [Actinomycetota bacterium]